MKQSNVGDIPFALFNWSDMTELTEDLAKAINGQAKDYDRIVALANGGLTMVRHLADRLNQKTISLLQISSYQGVAEHDPEPIIQQPLPMDVQGEKLLIFEDIVDTGATLVVMDKYLDAIGVENYQVATLVEKSQTVRRAEFVGARNDSWIIFPYEIRETILDLNKKWQSVGLGNQDIRDRLTEIGFNSADLDLYLN